MFRNSIKSLIIALLISSLAASSIAQTPPASQTAHSSQQSRARRKAQAPASKKPDCRSGDYILPIDPNATGSFTVPVCIAPHSPVMIEFPGDDPFYAHLPGDENFVTIDRKSQPNDPLVIRPGDGFYVQPGRARPSSVITVQMSSGLVGAFPIYPVEDASYNTNHVIISYSRAEVIAARRRLHLRADLVTPERLAQLQGYNGTLPSSPSSEQASTTPPRATSEQSASQPAPSPLPPAALASHAEAMPPQQSATPHPSPTPSSSPQPLIVETLLPLSATIQSRPAPSPAPAVVDATAPAASQARASTMSTLPPAPIESAPYNQASADLESVARDEMNRVINSSQQLKFSAAVHGLSLAVNRSRFIISGYRIEVIAVRNTLSEPIRLAPSQPEIYVETMHRGSPINAPRLIPRATISTLAEGAPLLPGATYYFAFAFDEPVLGVNDFLRVAVSQSNAADEPVSANLITSAR